MNNNSSVDNFDPETYVLNKYERFIRSVYVFIDPEGPFEITFGMFIFLIIGNIVAIIFSFFMKKLFLFLFGLPLLIIMIFFFTEGRRLKRDKPTVVELNKAKEEKEKEDVKKLDRHNKSLNLYSGVIKILLKNNLLTQDEVNKLDYVELSNYGNYNFVFNDNTESKTFYTADVLAYNLKLKKEEVES